MVAEASAVACPVESRVAMVVDWVAVQVQTVAVVEMVPASMMAVVVTWVIVHDVLDLVLVSVACHHRQVVGLPLAAVVRPAKRAEPGRRRQSPCT